MEIIIEDYWIYFEEVNKIFYFWGFLWLEGMKEYQFIMNIMLEILFDCSELIINLEGLEFFNSFGISMLFMFVMKVWGKEDISLVFKGFKNIFW